jgi:HSP20 family protein
MTLVRWNPIRDFSALQNQVNRLFEDAMGTWPGESNGRGNTNWVPPADIYENDNNLIVRAELPGVDPKMVDVRVENNVLTIRGERPFEQKVEKENYHRLERSYGTFSRSFTLPATIDSDKIRAEYRDGILNLTLPKSEKPNRSEFRLPPPLPSGSMVGREPPAPRLARTSLPKYIGGAMKALLFVFTMSVLLLVTASAADLTAINGTWSGNWTPKVAFRMQSLSRVFSFFFHGQDYFTARRTVNVLERRSDQANRFSRRMALISWTTSCIVSLSVPAFFAASPAARNDSGTGGFLAFITLLPFSLQASS